MVRVSFGLGIASVLCCANCGGGSGGGEPSRGAGDAGTSSGGASHTGAGGKSSNGGKASNDGASSGGALAMGTGGRSASGASGSDTGYATCTSEPQHMGPATYYTTADGSGNCSFDPSPDDLMIGAMNHVDYDGSDACGGCAKIAGPNGDITVRIVDQCPECDAGHIDLSPEAFQKIAPLSAGRVSISWQYVSCAVTGPVVYYFKQGSNQWWTAVQLRNHSNRIAKFEFQKGSTFVAVEREDYNYFVAASGMGPGPYTFRVTDVYGNQITDTDIVFHEAAGVSGRSQFPRCSEQVGQN